MGRSGVRNGTPRYIDAGPVTAAVRPESALSSASARGASGQPVGAWRWKPRGGARPRTEAGALPLTDTTRGLGGEGAQGGVPVTTGEYPHGTWVEGTLDERGLGQDASLGLAARGIEPSVEAPPPSPAGGTPAFLGCASPGAFARGVRGGSLHDAPVSPGVGVPPGAGAAERGRGC